jgi:hypothetical protein
MKGSEPLAKPKPNTNKGPDLAEHAPVWQWLKKEREKKAVQKKKDEENDRSRW